MSQRTVSCQDQKRRKLENTNQRRLQMMPLHSPSILEQSDYYTCCSIDNTVSDDVLSTKGDNLCGNKRLLVALSASRVMMGASTAPVKFAVR
jgi:hypothetical protein